jgi:hypothetical protein
MPSSGAARPAPTSLAELDRRVRPLTLAGERTLPVDEALRGLLPGGLPRGVTVAVSGGAARSFALALAAAASREGSWVAVVGLPGLGWRAAAELGVAVNRVVAVDVPDAARGADCVAAALDGFDVVLIGAGVQLGAAAERRLAARARERGSVLVGVHEPWVRGRWTARPGATGAFAGGADVRATAEGGGWDGLGDGTGRLQARRVRVAVEGKRLPGRRRRADLWLPDPDGRVREVEPTASVVPHRLPHQDPGCRLAPPDGPNRHPERGGSETTGTSGTPGTEGTADSAGTAETNEPPETARTAS